MIRQQTLDKKLILTDTQGKKLLAHIDQTKNSACQNWGWNFTLYDKEDKESGYPFLHLKIYWPEENNEDVIERVNKEIFEYCAEKIGYADLATFCNNYNANDCHTAFCGLTEDHEIAEWLLESGIGKVFIRDSEDQELLAENGLKQTLDGFSPIGKISDKPHPKINIAITDKGKSTGKFFIPNQLTEIPCKVFDAWLDSQDRFSIVERSAHENDFAYAIENATKTILEYRSNPTKFLEDYPRLIEVIA